MGIAFLTDFREYYLPRARISPPDELLPLIWPELDKWPREAFAHGRIEDMAACAFTDLLLHLPSHPPRLCRVEAIVPTEPCVDS